MIRLASLYGSFTNMSRFTAFFCMHYSRRPAALDTAAFGYLAPLFYVPWKNKEVREELFADNLDKFHNLKSYVDRIRKRYFEGLTAKSVVLLRSRAFPTGPMSIYFLFRRSLLSGGSYRASTFMVSSAP